MLETDDDDAETEAKDASTRTAADARPAEVHREPEPDSESEEGARVFRGGAEFACDHHLSGCDDQGEFEGRGGVETLGGPFRTLKEVVWFLLFAVFLAL